MQPHVAPAPHGPGRLCRLARKELTEILRDRRTIVTLVVMPLLLYPLITLAFGPYVLGNRTEETAPVYRIGYATAEDGQELFEDLGLGGGWRPDGGVMPLPRPLPEVKLFPVNDPEDSVRRGEVVLAFRRKTPGRAAPGPWAVDWEVIYRKDSAYAQEALAYVERLCARTNANYLSILLHKQGIEQRPAPTRLRPVPLEVEDRGGLSLAVFVPLVLVMMTITGAVYPAIDLTAGERERGTLEVLIAAPVPRVSLLFGKYVAVLTVAVLTALVNLTAMTVSLLVSGFAPRVFGPGGIRVLTLLEVFALLLLFAAFFSAVLLVLTSFARSFKEAQAYIIPLMVVALVPGVLGLFPGLPLSGALAVVPLLNIVLLARDLLDSQARADPLSAAVVVLSTGAYAALAVTLAAQVFGSEAVLYGEAGGWRALLRRKG